MNIKTLLIIGVLLCSLQEVNGQAQITISNTINENNIMGRIYLPIDNMPHHFDDVDGKCITIYGKDNHQSITIPIQKPEFVGIEILGSLSLDLFIEPRDNLEILLSQANGIPSIVFKGSNAAGHALYEDEILKINERQMVAHKQNAPVASIINETKEWDDAIKLKFKQIREMKLISETFEKSMVAKLQLYYLIDIYRNSQAKLKDPAKRDSTILLLNALNSFINVFNPQYGFEIFPLIVKSTYLHQGVIKDSSPKYTFWDTSSNLKHYNYIPLEKQSALIGDLINSELKNSYGEVDVDKMFEILKTNFPKSEYIPIIENRIAAIRSKQVVTVPDFATLKNINGSITVLDSVQVKPINELLKAHFNQQPVYIDLWALWCGGCLNQIRNTPSFFHSFMEKNGINVLYIFMDKAQAKNRWVNYIQEYNMKGYHIHVDDKWMKDFQKTLGITVKEIPRFLLIGKDGKLLLDGCKGPVEGDELYKQLKKALNM